MEALTQGVHVAPNLLTPGAASQYRHLVCDLDVAFEFIEVRTEALGLKPIYLSGNTPTGTLDAFQAELNGILDGMLSEVGARKRANVEKC